MPNRCVNSKRGERHHQLLHTQLPRVGQELRQHCTMKTIRLELVALVKKPVSNLRCQRTPEGGNKWT